MSAYYGQPVRYFTDEISENQLTMLIECMAESLSNGEYEAGENSDDVDLEKFRQLYGGGKEVRR